MVEASGIEWVLLTYRVPREPSTPRIAIWRRLKRLGVAQLGDGLVALPADARTQEQLEWVAEQVEQAGGAASLWRARPATREQERRMVEQMSHARAEEYRQVRARTSAAAGSGPGAVAARAVLTRLRAEQRRIERRDYFPPPERAHARSALRELTAWLGVGEPERTDDRERT